MPRSQKVATIAGLALLLTVVGLAIGLRRSPSAPRGPADGITPESTAAGIGVPPGAQNGYAFGGPPLSSEAAAGVPNRRLQEQLNPLPNLRRLVRENPEDVDARIRLAVALDQRGETSEAEDVLREALQRGMKVPKVYHALGMLYLRHGLYYGAVEVFRIERKLAPNDAQARLNLAQAYAYMNLPEPALKEFEAARKLNPSLPDIYLGLAYLNNTSERYPIAVKHLQEYIRLAPQPGPAHALLSRVYVNMRLFDKAIESGRKAVEAMPENPACWYNLGQAYAYHPGEQHFAEAAEAFERTLQLAGNWGGAHFELGRVYERLGRPEEAVARYRDAVRYLPTNGKVRYQLGRLLVQRGLAEEGQREIAVAQKQIRLNLRETQLITKIATDPKEPKHLYDLARVYRDLREFGKARATLETLLRMAPGYKGAAAALAEVRKLELAPG